jgi:hypothetical protein
VRSSAGQAPPGRPALKTCVSASSGNPGMRATMTGALRRGDCGYISSGLERAPDHDQAPSALHNGPRVTALGPPPLWPSESDGLEERGRRLLLLHHWQSDPGNCPSLTRLRHAARKVRVEDCNICNVLACRCADPCLSARRCQSARMCVLSAGATLCDKTGHFSHKRLARPALRLLRSICARHVSMSVIVKLLHCWSAGCSLCGERERGFDGPTARRPPRATAPRRPRHLPHSFACMSQRMWRFRVV